ncbi:molybdenum cofactor synthesis domain-containing protein [Bradyrhizobium sp. i1.4.4]
MIDARHVAILAASGVPNVKVRRRIAVGVLSTGSELVAARHSLGQHQIHDSNGPMLAALLGGPALRVTPLGRCRDDRGRLARRLAQMARSYDLLVCSGGVSGSDADHMVAAVHDAGGACANLALALKPGKPLAVGAIGSMAVLALPGNPFRLAGGRAAVRPSHAAGSGRQLPGASPATGCPNRRDLRASKGPHGVRPGAGRRARPARGANAREARARRLGPPAAAHLG